MAKTKIQKEEIIKDLKQNLTNQKAVVFIDFQGLSAKTLFELRNNLKEADCLLRVTKKTLLRLVLKSLEDSSLKEKIRNMEGELALVFGFKDEIIPAKIIYQFSNKNENLKILGGIVKNQKQKIKNQEYNFLTVQEIIELALISSEEELSVRLVRALNAPMTNFVDVLKANLRNFVFILSQKVNQ